VWPWEGLCHLASESPSSQDGQRECCGGGSPPATCPAACALVSSSSDARLSSGSCRGPSLPLTLGSHQNARHTVCAHGEDSHSHTSPSDPDPHFPSRRSNWAQSKAVKGREPHPHFRTPLPWSLSVIPEPLGGSAVKSCCFQLSSLAV
jgi:hypothetical protein